MKRADPRDQTIPKPDLFTYVISKLPVGTRVLLEGELKSRFTKQISSPQIIGDKVTLLNIDLSWTAGDLVNHLIDEVESLQETYPDVASYPVKLAYADDEDNFDSHPSDLVVSIRRYETVAEWKSRIRRWVQANSKPTKGKKADVAAFIEQAKKLGATDEDLKFLNRGS